MRADYHFAAGVPPCRLTEAAKSLLQHRPTGMALPVLGRRTTHAADFPDCLVRQHHGGEITRGRADSSVRMPDAR